MKIWILTLFAVSFLYLGSTAESAEHMPGNMKGHQHATGTATESVHADVKKQQACAHCGMDREKFSHSRMLITYVDGSSVGVCSIHCRATEMKNSKEKTIKSVMVADFNTKKLIDAEKATWVIGGSRNGVMTQTPKWAFAQKKDAAAFVKKNGGNISTYQEALKLAEQE